MKTDKHSRLTSRWPIAGALTLLLALLPLAPAGWRSSAALLGGPQRPDSANSTELRKFNSTSPRDTLFQGEPPSDDLEGHNNWPSTTQEDSNADSATISPGVSPGPAPSSESQRSGSSAQDGTDPNHTIVAYTTADDGPGSLRQALRDASDGDKINITARGTITLTSGELIVDKSLIIRGPGKSNLGVSGNNASRVFHIVPNVTVTIADLKITNGRATGTFPANAGGGILNDHASLTIERCIISGNSARFGGGILSNSKDGGSATLTVTNSTIGNNKSRLGYGGGIFSGGGFINGNPSGDATLILNTTSVTGNSAGFGGGIFNDGFNGNATATVNNSTVSNNTVKWPQDRDDPIFSGGGGIYNNGDSGVATLTLTGSTVSGNVSGEFFTDEEFTLTAGNGGGIYNDGLGSVRPGNARVTLTNTNVNGNEARSNEVGGYGGGIINEAGDLGSAAVTVTASDVNGNWADQYGGGLAQVSASGEAAITVNGSTLNGNNNEAVANFGGAPGINPDVTGYANAILSDTVVRENSGFEAILNFSANLQVTGCDISDNLGAGVVSKAVSSSPAFASIADSVISRNRLENGTGGGVVNFGADGRSTLTITNTTIRENSALSGGGIANFTNIGGWVFLTVDKSTVSDNHAGTGGGLLNDTLAGQAYATLTNCTLSGNSAEGDVSDPDHDYAGGGGILNGNGTHNPFQTYTGTATIDLINCTLSGNSTDRTGGAIANRGASTFSPTLLARVSLNSCTLSGNSAAQGGNTIWNMADVDDVPCIPDPDPCTDPGPGVAKVDFANTIFNVGSALEDFLNISPGTITSRGYNLASDAAGGDGSFGPGGFLMAVGDIRNTNPMLGPLQNNGGPTLTHALLFYSPALNTGDPDFNPYAFNPPLLYDQRGVPDFPRVVAGRIDIGAYELKYP